MKIMEVTMEILRKIGDFFNLEQTFSIAAMEFFGYNCLDFDAPSLGRFPLFTLWPWPV